MFSTGWGYGTKPTLRVWDDGSRKRRSLFAVCCTMVLTDSLKGDTVQQCHRAAFESIHLGEAHHTTFAT